MTLSPGGAASEPSSAYCCGKTLPSSSEGRYVATWCAAGAHAILIEHDSKFHERLTEAPVLVGAAHQLLQLDYCSQISTCCEILLPVAAIMLMLLFKAVSNLFSLRFYFHFPRRTAAFDHKSPVTRQVPTLTRACQNTRNHGPKVCGHRTPESRISKIMNLLFFDSI